MNAEAIASRTTAAGTRMLAVATFFATRSANRASRISERSLLATLRPVLMSAQLGDPKQKVGFADDHWTHIEGPLAAFEQGDDVIYLVVGLRNFGNGIGIIQAWNPLPERILGRTPHEDPAKFRPQTRALYIPPGGVGFWQGALRDPAERIYEGFAEAIKNRTPVTVDLLYTDMNGGQCTITRVVLIPGQQERWYGAVSQHWTLDNHTPISPREG